MTPFFYGAIYFDDKNNGFIIWDVNCQAMQEDGKVLRALSGNIVVTDSISVAKLKFSGIKIPKITAGDEPLPYDATINSCIYSGTTLEARSLRLSIC